MTALPRLISKVDAVVEETVKALEFILTTRLS